MPKHLITDAADFRVSTNREVAFDLTKANGQKLTLVMPERAAAKIMRNLLDVMQALREMPRPPASVEKASSVAQYEVGPGFPDAVVLVLETTAYGRQPFALHPKDARRIADVLTKTADHVDQQKSTQKKN